MKILKKYVQLPLLAIAFFAYISFLQIYALCAGTDTDLYFLINNGWEVINTHHIPSYMFNTIHQGFHTVMQQWAMCVVDAIAYNIAGYLGIKIVSILGYIIAVGIVYSYISNNVDNNSLRMLALSVVILPFGFFMNGRPWEASICIVCAFMYFGDKYCKSGNYKWLIAWPFLSVILSNFHAALWGLLLCFGITYVFPDLMVFKTVSTIKKGLVPDIMSKRTIWLFYLMMIPAACIGPNGIQNITYLFKSYGTTSGNARLTISEMARPEIVSISGVVVLIAILFLIYYIKIFWDKCNWQAVYLAIGCIILGVMHLRNVWICSIGIMPVICCVFHNWENEKCIEIETNNRWLKKLLKLSEIMVSYDCISIMITCIFVSAISICIFVMHGGCHNVDSVSTPVMAADYLDDVDEDIVLFTEFNNGAYLMFRGYDVYFHAQPELYGIDINKQKDIYEEYQDLRLESDYDYESFIESYGFNYLCIMKDSNIYQYIKYSDEYTIVVDSEDYILAHRTV